MTKVSTLLFERNVLNLNQIRLILKARTTVVTDVAGDHASINQQSTGGVFGAPLCYQRLLRCLF